MAKVLSPTQLSQYRRQGLTYPVRVLSAGQAENYRGCCDELERRLGGKPRTVQVRQMHLHFPWAWKLASQPAIVDAAEALLGPDLVIWATELFAKHPHDANVSIGWHRDRPYMGLDGDNVTTTAWVALSASTMANGCMCAVPLDRPQPAEETRVPDDAEQIRVTLEPGEMSLHNPDILHGSAPNLSAEKRVGFVIRYANPEARPLNGWPRVVAVRGQVGHERFQFAEQPSPSDAELALQALKDSAAQHFDVVLQNLRLAKR
jgi:hypothetical protein